jgi:two-component system osmolarity sensor histidine kinase EnvZ
MKKNVRELIENRMITLAGISHDLRTPLTKMKLQLTLMPRSKERDWLMDDVDTMIKITESFTIHAAEQSKEIFTRRNLKMFLKEVVKDYQSDNFRVYVLGNENVELSVKYTSLKRAFGNIISNSQKYANNLYINYQIEDSKIIVNFEDDGVGLDETAMHDIFYPFIKQNTARTHGHDDGVGLGLSITRDSVIAHGGTIVACNSKTYGGAWFKVTIPLGLPE